jgi:ABC-2 type transport system permease protein
MRWNRLVAMARKESLQILRDPRSLLIVLTMPLLLMLLYGYGINLDYKHVPVYVLDWEGSQQSRDLLKPSKTRTISTWCAWRALSGAGQTLDAEHCQIAVIRTTSPAGSNTSRPVAGKALVDATDDNGANLVMGYAERWWPASRRMFDGWTSRQGLAGRHRPSASSAHLVQRGLSKAFITGVIAIVWRSSTPSLPHHRPRWARRVGSSSPPVARFEIMIAQAAPSLSSGSSTPPCAPALPLPGSTFLSAASGPHSSSSALLLGVLGLGYFISTWR